LNRDLLTLVQWLSPAFPTGAFAYSHGLEWAIAAGEVSTGGTLANWLDDILKYGAGMQDAILLAHALRAGADFDGLDQLARALVPSSERLTETTEQGAALARTVSALKGCVMPARTLPVAFGAAAFDLEIPHEQTVALYLHSFTANLVSVAVRFVPLGQTEGQQVLAGLHQTIGACAAAACAASLDDLGSSVLRGDIAAMRHETMDVRIFRT
jgi:urease accessory protein